jgi:hypothetical protein
MTPRKPSAPSLSERALLVTLNISQWTARKLDRRETNDVNARHGLTVEAARVNKKLLPMGMQLERVHQTTRIIRNDFAKRTLPWGIDGVNILKAEAYEEFVQVVNDWRTQFESAVDDFVAAYPEQYKEARLMLGTMFREEDYPAVSDIRRRFGFSVRFMPMSDARDFRVDIGDEARQRLIAQTEEMVASAQASAMAEAWKRVYDVVSRANERLREPDTIFKASLVDNAVELCRLLPMLNLTNDPALEKARREIEGSLCKHTPDTLRSDPKVRKDVADKMADIMNKMSGFYTPQAA